MAPIAHSKLTAQGQVSVPAAVRRRLGVGPGAVLEWDDEGGDDLAETAWVLSAVYGLAPAAIAAAVEMLLNQRNMMSFSDCLVLEIARKAGHLPVGTFDRQLAKLNGARKL